MKDNLGESGVGDYPVQKYIKQMPPSATEELDRVRSRVVIFTKKPEDLALNVEVAGLRHLVRVFPSCTVETSRTSELATEDRGSGIICWRVLEDEELPGATSVTGQPLDEL